MGEVLDMGSVCMREDLRAGSPSMARVRRVCAASELHDELLIFIVTRLDSPLQTIFQLRSVCKTWYTPLADPHFLRYVLQLLSQTPLYIVTPLSGGEDILAACDIRIKGWHKWVPGVHSKYFSLYDVRGDVGDWLLLQKDCDSSAGLFLANPTKKSLRKLPRVPEEVLEWVPCTIGVGLDKSSKSCKVFALKRLSFYSYKAYLYDFELNSWEAFGAWQLNKGERMCRWMFYEGALHCIRKTKDGRDGIFHACRYDERNSRWQVLEPPAQISGRLHFQKLFEWQGHLMLIGVRADVQSHDAWLAGVHIWQLDKKKQVWVEIMRMPDHLVDHFYVAEVCVLGFHCATCKDQLCLTSEATLKRGDTSEERYRHVMCDLSKALWWDVPEPPFVYDDHDLNTPRISPLHVKQFQGAGPDSRSSQQSATAGWHDKPSSSQTSTSAMPHPKESPPKSTPSITTSPSASAPTSSAPNDVSS